MEKHMRKPKKSATTREIVSSVSNLAMERERVLVKHATDPAPSPLKIENFVPWLCGQLHASTSVLITSKLQEHLPEKSVRKLAKHDVLIEESIISESVVLSKPMKSTFLVPVTAYYDLKDRLVEIAIVRSNIRPSKKVITAFSLCVPYHSSLTRFTYRKSGLTAALVYEINKLIPISNISEIVFDDSYVPEANYYILLEQISQLRYLSLNRCGINDEVCKKIFENIKFNAPSANSLQVLELGSNDITDNGAKFIGSVLRENRCLLHLNLSGNKITDSGFLPILDSLMEFPLNFKERYEMRQRRMSYLKSKAAIYERCLNNLKCNMDKSESTDTSRERVRKGLLMKRSRSKPKRSQVTLEEQPEIMTRGILGEFQDPFSPNNVVVTNEVIHSKGNFILCYINIAYNHLENLSVQRLLDVLRYQDDMRGKTQSGLKERTGLIKITLDGNHIPTICSSQLEEINIYLKNVIFLRSPSAMKKISFKKNRNGNPISSAASHHEHIKK